MKPRPVYVYSCLGEDKPLGLWRKSRECLHSGKHLPYVVFWKIFVEISMHYLQLEVKKG